MNYTEQMAKLRSIITGETSNREQLNEMFSYPKDKSPEGQRVANMPQDALAKRGAVKNPIAKDPAGYKGMVKGTSTLHGKTTKDLYKMHGPKGTLPEEASETNSELDNLMKKYGVMEEGTCNMTAEGEKCPVHGLEECGMYEDEMEEARKPDFLDFDGDGNTDEPMVDAINDKEEGVSESVHITLDGPEADAMIQRLIALAGQPVEQNNCESCGSYECGCANESPCNDCGSPNGQCCCDDVMTMENADHDFGHENPTSEGVPVNPSLYMFEPDQEPQRFVKSPGDNPLIKEDSTKLYAKLRYDYRAYIAEADLARSNTGTDSPLTATDRDEFEKDPFKDEDAVTDGSHSPLSTIIRQKVSK